MKSVLLKGPGKVVFEDIPVPDISADEVLVEVKYCGICGSDIHSVPDCNLYQAGAYLGHEFSGVVAKAGRNVKGWQKDRHQDSNNRNHYKQLDKRKPGPHHTSPIKNHPLKAQLYHPHTLRTIRISIKAPSRDPITSNPRPDNAA